MGQLLTTKEAARYLRVSERQLKQLRAGGFGPDYSRPSHRVIRYRTEDLDAWVERHLQRSSARSGS